MKELTLKEQLDEKVMGGSAEALWKEIKELFLNTDVQTLKEGLTIVIFSDRTGHLFYIIGKVNYTKVPFKQYYNNKDILEKIILICKENGLHVTEYDDKIYISYTPS